MCGWQGLTMGLGSYPVVRSKRSTRNNLEAVEFPLSTLTCVCITSASEFIRPCTLFPQTQNTKQLKILSNISTEFSNSFRSCDQSLSIDKH